MNPVVEGLAVNGLTVLSGKIVSQIYQKYSLPIRMRKDLARNNSKESTNAILDALERTIGNVSGLTPATNLALLDISNSGLLDHLIIVFGSDLPHIDAKRLTTYIHLSRGSKDEALSNVFSDQLATCLQTVWGEIEKSNFISQDQGFLRFQKLRVESAKRSASIISALTADLFDKNGQWISDRDFSPQTISRQIGLHSEPINNYVKSVLRTLNTVDVHGASGDVVRVELDEIYVDVPVSFIPRERNFINYQDLRRQLPRTEIAANWSDTLRYVSKTVLLGDPGGGKSTLSKKLCSEISKKFLAGETTLPIFVQLRTYIAKAVDDERLSLCRYILDQISSSVLDPEDSAIEATILYHLRIGAAFIVTDGLDEVLTPSNRARVVEELQMFSKEFPLSTLLVTSRYVGYETQPMNGFTHLGVDHLDDAATEKIYRNVSRTVLNRDANEVERNLPVFLSDARRKAAELIQSPLLLTLIVIIYSKKSEIPDNRAGLYGFCADLLFERWDGYRDIVPELPERYRLFDLFKHLSAILYEKEEYGGRINRDSLISEARNFFRKDYIDNREGKSAEAAKHMVDHLTGRAWILHEVGEDVFEFTHRTFLEFFYARHLETVFESTAELVSECLRHVSSGSRTVPSHLALQVRTKDKRDASSTVCRILGDAVVGEACSSELIDFCLDALGYLLPDAKSMSDFISNLAPAALYSDSAIVPMKLLCNEGPMSASILTGSLSVLSNINKVSTIRVLAPALRKLHHKNRGMLHVASKSDVNVCSLIIEQSYAKQSSSPFLCKLAFDLDERTNWEALEKFGLRIWASEQFSSMTSIILDSRKMLSSASKSLVDADFVSDKYLQLSTILCKETARHVRSISFEHFYVNHLYRHESRNSIDVAVDPSSWRDDKRALEAFAFSFTLFLETNIELLLERDVAKYKRCYLDLIEALESCKSDQTVWYLRWWKGECRLIGCQRTNADRLLQSFVA